MDIITSISVEAYKAYPKSKTEYSIQIDTPNPPMFEEEGDLFEYYIRFTEDDAVYGLNRKDHTVYSVQNAKIKRISEASTFEYVSPLNFYFYYDPIKNIKEGGEDVYKLVIDYHLTSKLAFQDEYNVIESELEKLSTFLRDASQKSHNTIHNVFLNKNESEKGEGTTKIKKKPLPDALMVNIVSNYLIGNERSFKKHRKATRKNRRTRCKTRRSRR